MKQNIQRYNQKAKDKGVRVVSCCGYDRCEESVGVEVWTGGCGEGVRVLSCCGYDRCAGSWVERVWGLKCGGVQVGRASGWCPAAAATGEFCL